MNFMQELSRPQAWWFTSVKAKQKRKKKQKTPNRKSPRRGARNLPPQHRASPRASTVRCEATSCGARQRSPGAAAAASCAPPAGALLLTA